MGSCPYSIFSTIFLILHGNIPRSKNLSLFLCSYNSKHMLKNTFKNILRFSNLIDVENLHLILSEIPLNNMVSANNSVYLILRRKMTAKGKHRHIITTPGALLHDAYIPYKFWVEAILTTTYLINRLPSQITNMKSPYQLLYNQQPSYEHLKIFGCLCYPWLAPTQRHKFQPRVVSCVFLSYARSCFNPQNGQFIISRHVKFVESIFPF